NRSTRDIPMIVLSSREQAVTKAQAFALGANDYLVKLPDKLEVIARLRYHSRGYLALLERTEASEPLAQSQRQPAGEVASPALHRRQCRNRCPAATRVVRSCGRHAARQVGRVPHAPRQSRRARPPAGLQ